MSEPIRDVETAVRERGALPVPVGPEPTLKGVAEDVIARAMRQGRTAPALIAEALESAQLLQSPETAAELAAFRSLELGDADGRVSASCGQPHHPTWLRKPDAVQGCPWCDLDKAHDDLIGANLSLHEEEQETARLRLALASAQRGRRRLRARVAELEARLAEYERPANEAPIAYALTEQADEDCDHPNGYGPYGCAGCGAFAPAHDEDDVAPQVEKLRSILAGQREQVQGGGR